MTINNLDMKKKTVTVLAIEYSKGCVILNLN